jgi:hypothetical protein
MEKTYFVVCKKEYDIVEIEKELEASGGNEFVPERAVACTSRLSQNNTMSGWKMSEEEAASLRNDPRILSVLDPITQQDGVAAGIGTQQIGDKLVRMGPFHQDYDDLKNLFTFDNIYKSKYKKDMSSKVLTRHSKKYGDTLERPEEELQNVVYSYEADGEGIDIVVLDMSFGDLDNPEFLDDEGKTRFKPINWYEAAGDPDNKADQFDADKFYQFTQTEYNDGSTNPYLDHPFHGIAVAQTCAGKSSGFAKGAHIYSAQPTEYWTMRGQYLPASSGVVPRLLPVEGFAGITLEETLECVRLWHLRKMSPDGNQRPTIIVTSTVYPDKIFSSYGMPVRGTYRGQDWMYDGETTEELKRQYKLDFKDEIDLTLSSYKVLGSSSRGYDDQGDIVHFNTVEILLKQCSEAGIHVVSAAGNEDYYSDIPSNFPHPAKENNPNAGLDFNNVVVFEDETGRERTFTYNQPTAPWFDGIIKVGANNLSGNTENKQDYSNFGPSVGPYLEVGNSAPSIANYGWTSVFETIPNNIDSSYNDIVEVSSFNKRSYFNTLQKIQDLEDGNGRIEFGYQARYYPFSGTDPRWFYYDFSGTSNASPNCAGLLACILEKEPTLTPIQARNRLFELATDKLDFSDKLDDYTDIYTEGYVAFNPYSKTQNVQLEGKVYLESGHNPWLANSYIEILGGNDSEIQLGVTAYKEIRLHLRDDDGNKVDPDLINDMGGGTWGSEIQKIIPNQLIVNDNQVLNTYWAFGSNPVTDGYFKATYNTPDVLGTYVITAKVRGEFIAQDPASITRGYDDNVKPTASVSTDYDKVTVGNSLGNNRPSAYYINNVPENVQEIAAVLVNDEFAENPTLTVTSISDGLVFENNFLSVPSSTDYATAQSYQADFVMTDGINSHSFTVYVNVIDQTAPVVNFSSSHGVVAQNGYDVTLTVNEDIGSGLSLLGVNIIDAGTTTATFTSNSGDFVYSAPNALILNKNPEASDVIYGILTVTDNSGNRSIYNISLNIADITPPQVSATAASGSFHLTQSGNDYVVQIDEGIGANQTIVNLSSLDDSLPVSYALGNSTSNEILLDGSAVKLTVNPDYSGTTTYTAEIISTDAVGNSFTTYITINVVEVLDIVDPVFTSTPNITIDEGINVGSNLMKFEATDDSGVVTYRKFTASDTWFGSLGSALMFDSLYDVDVTGQAYTTAEIDYSASGLINVSGAAGKFFYVGCVAVDPSGNKRGVIRKAIVNEVDDEQPTFPSWNVGDNDQTQFGTTGWSEAFYVTDNFGKANLTFTLNTSNPNDFTLTTDDVDNPVVTLAQAKQIADSPLTFSITATDEAGNETTSPDFTLNIVNDVTGPVFTGSAFVETIPWDAEEGFVICDNVEFTDDNGVASITKGTPNAPTYNMFTSIYDYDATDNKLKLAANWQNNYYIGMLTQAITPHHDEAVIPIAVYATDHTGNNGQRAEFVEVSGSTYTGEVMGHVTGVDISSLGGPQGAYGAQISVNEGSVGDEVARVHLMEYHGSGVHQHTGEVTSPYYRQPVTGSYTLTSADSNMPDDMFTIDNDGVIRTNIAADADLVDAFTLPNVSGVYNAWLKVTMDDPDDLKMPNGTPEGGQPQVYVAVNILNVDDEAPTWTASSIHVGNIAHPYTGGTLYDASQDVDDPDGDDFPLTYSIAPFFSPWSSPTMLVIDSSTGIVSSSSINTTSLPSVMIVGATITVTDTQGRSASRNIQLNFQPNPWTGTNMLTSWANPTTYPSTSQTSAYNVVDIPYDLTGTTWDGSVLTASDTISERIYIAHEMGGTTPTYFNDFCVGMVQVIDTNGNLVQDIGIGSNTSKNWQTVNATGSTLFNGGSSSIVYGIGQFGFGDATSTYQTNRWNYRTGKTPSGSQGGTGPVGGINSMNGMSALNVGIEQYSAASQYNYLYRESSSPSGGINYMRTKYDTVNMPTQGSIRIAYHNHGSHSSSAADNSMYVAIGSS